MIGRIECLYRPLYSPMELESSNPVGMDLSALVPGSIERDGFARLEQACELHPTDWLYGFLRVRLGAQWRRLDCDDLEASARRLYHDRPYRPEGCLALGFALTASEDREEEAEAMFLRACTIAPLWRVTWSARARFLLLANRPTEALECLEAASEIPGIVRQGYLPFLCERVALGGVLGVRSVVFDPKNVRYLRSTWEVELLAGAFLCALWHGNPTSTDEVYSFLVASYNGDQRFVDSLLQEWPQIYSAMGDEWRRSQRQDIHKTLEAISRLARVSPFLNTHVIEKARREAAVKVRGVGECIAAFPSHRSFAEANLSNISEAGAAPARELNAMAKNFVSEFREKRVRFIGQYNDAPNFDKKQEMLIGYVVGWAVFWFREQGFDILEDREEHLRFLGVFSHAWRDKAFNPPDMHAQLLDDIRSEIHELESLGVEASALPF